MKSMKSITTAGLCLVAMLVVSMVAAASASAAPHWLVCLAWTGGPTRYQTDQCKTNWTSGTGFEWSELKGTEAVRSHASLLLTDTKVPLVGEVSVSCTGEDAGSVGPGKYDRTTSITNIKCVPDKTCEAITKEVKPLNLPWQTELVEEGGNLRDKIRAENGKGAGWAITCKVGIVEDTDECTTEEGNTSVGNVWTKGIGETNGELLVLADFDEKSPNAKCTLGGAGSGKVRGTVATLLASGQALSVSK